MTETRLTVHGNLAGAPELRFTQSGRAVVGFTVAQNRSHFDRATQSYVDDPPLWMRCSAWGPLAENIAACLDKGDKVVAAGRLVPNEFETKEGEKRRTMELVVDSLGASLDRATVKVTKVIREASASTAEVPAPRPGAGRRKLEPAMAGRGDAWQPAT